MTWDVIVVGARCAGSPLARFLARAGKRVLLVDASPFPSDQPLSTHFIQPYGMRVLDELGLGDRVRAIAPPVTMCATLLDDVAMRVRFPLPPCCIRRVDLDHILVDGAREAGAELALQHRVVEVLRDGERVAGVVAEDPAGTRRELRASVVVGADGRHSTVAKLVGAEKYFHYEGPRAFYWAYWPRPAWYGAAPYEGGSYIAFRDQDVRLVFPVNRDQMLLGIGFPREQVDRYKADPRGALEAGLSADPFFGRLIADHEPIGKVIGVVKPEYFFRAAAGPGWALVGDAGLHKDPTPGLGIADALRDARNLAAAIVEGSDAARERYWRQRDVDSFELFNFARDMGELDYNNALSRIAVAKLAAPARVQRVIDMVDRKLSPYAVIKPTEAIAWTFGALLRGRFGVLKPFFKMGKRQAALMKELERRRALLVPALPSRSASERAAA
jgi:flavin-dependent dehydrogenase